MAIGLRPATMADWARIYAWRNDAETRARCTTGQGVTLPDHLKWLEATLVDKGVTLLVAELARPLDAWPGHGDGVPIGQVRLDVQASRKSQVWAECSIALDARFRGLGHGAEILAALQQRCKADPRLPSGIVAKVLHDNFASLRMFADAQFKVAKVTDALVTLEWTWL